MDGIKLTQQQADDLQNVFISASTFIEIVYDINDAPFLFLSVDDNAKIENTELSYLIDMPLSDYVPKIVAMGS